jgi:hypothetical protein
LVPILVLDQMVPELLGMTAFIQIEPFVSCITVAVFPELSIDRTGHFEHFTGSKGYLTVGKQTLRMTFNLHFTSGFIHGTLIYLQHILAWHLNLFVAYHYCSSTTPKSAFLCCSVPSSTPTFLHYYTRCHCVKRNYTYA